MTSKPSATDVNISSTNSTPLTMKSTDHLAASERKVTGLVFVLAGYLVHDLHETVPVILLDSLEAVDADRIATLIEHFQAYADYLVVALPPQMLLHSTRTISMSPTSDWRKDTLYTLLIVHHL
jgi:elongation factor P--beta-lysine ligase